MTPPEWDADDNTAKARRNLKNYQTFVQAIVRIEAR